MRSVSLFSGGKDSFLSAQIAMEQGFEIIAAITVVPEEFSFMFHYPNARMSRYVAEILDLDVIETSEDDLWKLIASMVEKDHVEAVISGATERKNSPNGLTRQDFITTIAYKRN